MVVMLMSSMATANVNSCSDEGHTIEERMKVMKNEEIDDDDGDDSHVLLGFDESTSYYNKSGSEIYATAGTPPNPVQYFRWSPESIKMMLTMRFDMDCEFAKRLRQKKDLWNEIAAEMGRLGGYVITGEVCDLKFRNMLQTYKKNRIKEERGLQELIIWEYYAFFKQAALRSVDANGEPLMPSLLCESICVEDTNSAPTKRCKKLLPIELPAEEETTLIPKRQSTRQKRPRLLSIQTHSENSFGGNEQLLAEIQKTLVQTEIQPQQNSTLVATPTEQEQQSEPSTSTKVESQATWCMQPPKSNWLTPTEQSECEVFGQSVGLQLANVRDSYARSLLKLRIQELIFLAGTGKLSDKYAFSCN